MLPSTRPLAICWAKISMVRDDNGTLGVPLPVCRYRLFTGCGAAAGIRLDGFQRRPLAALDHVNGDRAVLQVALVVKCNRADDALVIGLADLRQVFRRICRAPPF